ncbi:probable beta-1,3-galactosyltransferase 2 isoform X1 [Tanacetum coccineum]
MDDNIRVEREVGTENIGLKSYGESGKEDVDGKEIECLELIAPIELNEELNELVELKDKNKCLEVTNNFASEKYGIEDKNKRMGFSSLVYGGEIIDGAYSCDRNKSNVRSSANEQESVSSKALKESNNNDLNIKLLVNEKATMREFLSGHSKMLEEETLKVADQKEDKESSVKGNKMFPNESVDSDTVDSEFMVMEVDEFQGVWLNVLMTDYGTEIEYGLLGCLKVHESPLNSEKRKKLEEERGIIIAMVGGILDRPIEAEDRKHGDFLKFYINVDDDVHVNIATLGHTLVRHRKKKWVYIGCMKSGPVLAQNGIGRPVDRIKEVHRRCGIAVEMIKQGATTTVLSFLLSVLVLPARLLALTDIVDNRQG